MNLFIYLCIQQIKELYGTWYKSLFASIINLSTFLFINGYIFPMLGIFSSFGGFMVVGYVIQVSLFEILTHCTSLINDLKNTRRLQYELTLPIDARLVFVKYAVSYALHTSLLFAWILPIAKIILKERFDLTHTSIPQAICMYLAAQFFLGSLGLWLTSIFEHQGPLMVARIGVISPLWTIGCYAFPHKLLNQMFPKIAFLDYLNPFTYLHEGMRSAFFKVGYLPMPLCFTFIIIITIGMMMHALHRFKKRFDYL